MKKILFALILSVLFIPHLTFAHLYRDDQSESFYDIGTRVEVSMDGGVTWASLDSSDAPSLGNDQALAVVPGDTLLFRVRVWNEGNTSALTVVGTGTRQNFNYLTGLSGAFDNSNEDGDGTDITGGSIDVINISSLSSGGSATSGYQSATFSGTVSPETPDGTIIGITYTIDSADLPELTFLWNFFLPVAYADNDGTAITQAVAQVSNPPEVLPAAPQTLPQAGAAENYIYLTLGIMGAFLVGRKIRVVQEERHHTS